jgi:acyl carrier protein
MSLEAFSVAWVLEERFGIPLADDELPAALECIDTLVAWVQRERAEERET